MDTGLRCFSNWQMPEPTSNTSPPPALTDIFDGFSEVGAEHSWNDTRDNHVKGRGVVFANLVQVAAEGVRSDRMAGIKHFIDTTAVTLHTILLAREGNVYNRWNTNLPGRASTGEGTVEVEVLDLDDASLWEAIRLSSSAIFFLRISSESSTSLQTCRFRFVTAL